MLLSGKYNQSTQIGITTIKFVAVQIGWCPHGSAGFHHSGFSNICLHIILHCGHRLLRKPWHALSGLSGSKLLNGTIIQRN